MQALSYRSRVTSVADPSNNQLPPLGCMRQGQQLQRWGHGKQQPRIHQGIRQHRQGITLQFLLGLGVSLMGSGAIATSAPPAIAEPVTTIITSASDPASIPNSVTLPHPLAQGASDSLVEEGEGEGIDPAEEAIQGDSEARQPATSKGSIYAPIRLKSGSSVEDTLTTKDIPMGQGSFARDYVVTLKADDQVAIDLFSDSFDTVVTLMSENGTTLGENDDGPDGGTNSLLFMRITEDGDYVVRVRGFGQAKGGPFKLKLTRLKAAQ